MFESLMTSGSGGRGEASAAATAVVSVRSIDGLVERAINRTRDWLLKAQFQDGYWWGELEADTTLESDYILFLKVVAPHETQKIEKAANYVRKHQLEDGGWNIFPGGPSEVNATVKAYFGLRLAGDSATATHMLRARERAIALGGLEGTNSYARIYLALAGVLDWNLAPAIPPEIMLLPRWLFINSLEMSSWTRAIVIPLSILFGTKPKWPAANGITIDELFGNRERARKAFKWDKKLFSWRNFFLAGDALMKGYERLPWKPFRNLAIKRSKEWMIEHLQRSEGLAAIYPAMANSVFSLLALGSSVDDPLVKQQIAYLNALEIEEEDSLRLQPALSPVWDTAIAMVSLAEAGLDPRHPALIRAAKWLLDLQITGGGDWQIKNKEGESGGWAFEFRNDFFPDVDDTAFVLMALARLSYPDQEQMNKAITKALSWLLSMQNRDGGFAAFDRDNDLTLLNQIPFADHNAMLDPSTADVTARVIECLGKLGWSSDHPVIKNAMNFLQEDQANDGSWYGRWGVNYVYGTSGVLRAMEALKLTETPECARARDWLRATQNTDGGFGENLRSYNDSKWRGRGRSTASQTAWGLIGLLAVCPPTDPAVTAAVRYLTKTQNEDGTWDESEFTGTGFPGVFYLKYHLYRISFPLYALAHYRNLKDGLPEFSAFKSGSKGFKFREIHRDN